MKGKEICLLVTGSKFTKGKEDTIDYSKGSNVLRLGKLLIATGHDETHDSLQRDTERKGIPGPNPIAHKGAQKGAGQVKQVDDRVPAKHGGERGRVRVEDGRQDARAVDAKGVRGKVVNEPDECDDEQTRTVEAQGEHVGDAHMGHAVARKLLGLADAHTQEKEDQGEDDADTQTCAPLGAEVAVMAGGGDNVGDERASNETDVDGAIGEKDEPAVAGAGLELGRRLGGAHGAGWVFAANAHTDKEAPCDEHGQHAWDLAMPVGSGGKGCENEQEGGRDDQSVDAAPLVSEDAKYELAYNGTDKGNG